MKRFGVAAVSLALLVTACSGATEPPAQTSASAMSKAPVAAGAHGPVKRIGEALGEVSLRPDQRAAIEKLAEDAEARHAPLAEDRRALMLALADQIENGTLDDAAIAPKLAKAKADFERVRVADREAIGKLHDLLDAEQRGAFVDALEAKLRASHGGYEGMSKLKGLADEMKLTDAQKAALRSSIREGMREHFKAKHGGGKRALEAFREDKLDLDRVAPPVDLADTDHMRALAAKVLPVLTPEQRKIAADKLREAAAHP